MIKQDTIATKDGAGQWKFEIKYPEWGRYLVRACDLDGGHCTGRVFYIDWPSWAGAARDQSGPAANVLMITSDKAEYKVGETATVQLPEVGAGPRAAHARERQLASSSTAGSRPSLEAESHFAFRSPPAWRPTSTWR